MTIVVEDGTGLDNSNSYAAVATADEYFAQRGVAAWAALAVEVKESALINASEYADIRWGDTLRNRPLLSTQALEMPRRSLRDRYGDVIEGLPRDWVRGVMEYAIKSSMNSLVNTPVRREDNELRQQRVTVGPITRSNTFVTSAESKPVSSGQDFIVYPVADELCKQFTNNFGTGNGGAIRN